MRERIDFRVSSGGRGAGAGAGAARFFVRCMVEEHDAAVLSERIDF